MDRHGRSAVLLLAALSMASVAGAVGAYALKMQEARRRQDVEKQLALTISAKEALETELKDTQTAKAKVEDQLASLKWEAQSLTTQLEEEKKSKDLINEQIVTKQQELDQATVALEGERTQRVTMEERLSQVQAEYNELQRELQQIKEAKLNLENQLGSGQQGVQLPRVVVGSAPGGPPAMAAGPSVPLLNGQVLVVNREFDFVVVNLGKNNGLQVGQLFEIYRDGSVLGQVKVEKVYDALAACAIQPNTQKEQLREGDKVRSL